MSSHTASHLLLVVAIIALSVAVILLSARIERLTP